MVQTSRFLSKLPFVKEFYLLGFDITGAIYVFRVNICEEVSLLVNRPLSLGH